MGCHRTTARGSTEKTTSSWLDSPSRNSLGSLTRQAQYSTCPGPGELCLPCDTPVSSENIICERYEATQKSRVAARSFRRITPMPISVLIAFRRAWRRPPCIRHLRLGIAGDRQGLRSVFSNILIAAKIVTGAFLVALQPPGGVERAWDAL